MTVDDAFSALAAGVAAVSALDFDALPIRQRLEVMERLETARRRVSACTTEIAASVDRSQDPGIGPNAAKVIADVLRISPADARRRLRDAEQLLPRTSLTGQSMPPLLPHTAKGWDAGIIDVAHLRVIQKFFRELPEDVPAIEIEKAEEFLAEKAAELRPDQLEVVAARLAEKLNPDGTFSDDYRAAQRGFAWCGRQRPDGMSVGRLIATPELRATIDALLAKYAAPGMCNPADETPTVNDEPAPEVAASDRRLHAQRQHDGLLALLRSQLGSPALGQHNGLPVTIVVSTTLEQLTSGTGIAVTGGGSTLPMSDVIRMAAHSWHYLVVYDSHTSRPIYLGRSKRIASGDQRLILYHRDRGCTRPGCSAPGYITEVHHVDEWVSGGATDIDKLVLACPADHRLLTVGGWKTRMVDGTVEWIPPAHLPLRSGTNDYHHPERLQPE